MDINSLMKQAQSMQKKMAEMQKEFASKEYEGKSGGGLVSVVMTGDGKMQKVSFDESLLKPSEKEMLEDLVIAAYNDAKGKADSDSKNQMGQTFGNLGGALSGLKF